jgi:HPt (histidine-containing phosphotransfer) domain-containing protein
MPHSQEICPPPVDRAYLARFTRGNADLEREILDLFATQAPLYVERLRRAEDEKSWREAAHTLKGSASAVGAWRVVACAKAAEALAGSADFAAVAPRSEALAELAGAVDAACRYVAQLYDHG